MKYTIIALIAALAVGLFYSIQKNKEADQKMEQVAEKTTENIETNQPVTNADDPKQLVAFYADTNLDVELVTTESGLQYAVIKDANGDRSPTVTDTVEVHYHGTTMDGEVFDSSVLRGETIEFPLQNLIVGWQEGIPLMNVGDKYRLVVPAALAYGEEGLHPLAGKTLIFDIELFDFK